MHSATFGGILPLVTLAFVVILREARDADANSSAELIRAKRIVRELQAELAGAKVRITDTEERFAAAENLFTRLFAEDKRQRIIAAVERWPNLPEASIVVIASASLGYVSEVLKTHLDLMKSL